MLKMFICIAFLCLAGHIGANKFDDTLVFNKSIPNYETHLNGKDFKRARNIRLYQLLSARAFDTVDDSILYRSNRFEGDITGAGSPNVRQGVAYNGVTNLNRTWRSRRIPYTISSQYSNYARSQIAAAFDEYSRLTCVEFIPRSSEIDYLYITSDDGCYSMVGKGGGRQIVSLGPGCMGKGVIIHELMHAVGFFHEQSRNDRDLFVDVVWSNIADDMSDQFQKYSLNTLQDLGITYDYDSVMHYSNKAFSKNGQPTIVPKKMGVTIGQRRGFSELDVIKVNKLYGCENFKNDVDTSPLHIEQPIVQPIQPIQPTIVQPAQPVGISSSNNNAPNCLDLRNDCMFLTSVNYCQQYKEWMTTNCPKSCNLCNAYQQNVVKNCMDENDHCVAWAKAGFCESSLSIRDYMQRNCRKSCNLCVKI